MTSDRTADAPPEARLLVVDDEPNILELLATSLRFAGFEVATATNGRDALTEARGSRPDLVVLDVMMPDMDGFAVVRRMRGEGTIVAGALPHRAGRDRGQGHRADRRRRRLRHQAVQPRGDRGADPGGAPAYVGPRQRRRTTRPGSTFADIELDDDTHEVWKAGELVALSPTEFKLLRYFMQNAGRVLSKSQILDHVWHYDFGGEANVVESYVSYLRRKVDTTEPRLLHTLRGVGYVLRMPRG